MVVIFMYRFMYNIILVLFTGRNPKPEGQKPFAKMPCLGRKHMPCLVRQCAARGNDHYHLRPLPYIHPNVSLARPPRLRDCCCRARCSCLLLQLVDNVLLLCLQLHLQLNLILI